MKYIQLKDDVNNNNKYISIAAPFWFYSSFESAYITSFPFSFQYNKIILMYFIAQNR